LDGARSLSYLEHGDVTARPGDGQCPEVTTGGLSQLAVRAYQESRLRYGWLRHPGNWAGIRVFGYHRVSEEPGDLSVHPEAFALQMEEIAATGVEVVPLERALDLLEAGEPGRHICITFDDGYRDVLENGVPVLERFGFPATIYVPTAIIDGDATFYWYDDPPPALTWDELGRLAAGGLVDIQAHSVTHPWLPSLDDETARREIAGSKTELEAKLGRPVTSFCFPAGLFGRREVGLVRAAGYRAALTTDAGVNRRAGSPALLRRTLVFWDDSPRVFSAKLHGLLDHPSLAYRRVQRQRRSQTAPGYGGPA
jgi:peptidoglycan/xylan/chitin deacetylase (PgdA/CDA1 family)